MRLSPIFLTTPLAHRGFHDVSQRIPENSAAGIRRAISGGFGAEIDLQLSADGVAMVFHDNTLDRMTDAVGPVRDWSCQELSDLKLNRSDETIHTFRQILHLVDGRAPLLVELKDQSGHLEPGPDDLERAVASDLEGYRGPVAVMSFNPYVIKSLRELAPNITRGIISEAFDADAWPRLSSARREELRNISSFDRVAADFISHDCRDLGNPRVAELKAKGVPILCWTVRSPGVEVEARHVADNVTFEGYVPTLDPD
jgi:glycerophosphoryl diester phosphodiesterase